MRQLICQIDYLQHRFFDLLHDPLQKPALFRVGNKVQRGHILCGVKDYRKLLPCKEQCGGNQSGAGGEVPLCGVYPFTGIEIMSLPQCSILQPVPRDKLYPIPCLVSCQNGAVVL